MGPEPQRPDRGKMVLLGVTGGIAAYKAIEVLRRLDERGFAVQVAMTRAAAQFVTPLTFQALSRRPVATDLFDLGQESRMAHIDLARRADVAVVAPATADFLARLAAGMGDDILTTLLLAARCPVVLAPAMNAAMWENPLVQANVRRLREVAGHTVVPPATGELACGEFGAGRLASPDEVVEAVLAAIGPADLSGRRILVDAGPTFEALDPVRFLGNRSSGKMGYAVARVARRRGASVTLVTGPTALSPPPGVEVVAVESAREMHRAVLDLAAGADAAVLAAAVADFRPREAAPAKIKKRDTGDALTLDLCRNPDILADLCRSPRRPRVVVGFAAETTGAEDDEALLTEGRRKLAAKGCDLLLANRVGEPGLGFGADRSRGLLLARDTPAVLDTGVLPKEELAGILLDEVRRRL